MAYGPSFSSRPMTMSPLHYQNFRNYLIDPPQAQQQYNQSKPQFILRYRVDTVTEQTSQTNKLIN